MGWGALDILSSSIMCSYMECFWWTCTLCAVWLQWVILPFHNCILCPCDLHRFNCDTSQMSKLHLFWNPVTNVIMYPRIDLVLLLKVIVRRIFSFYYIRNWKDSCKEVVERDRACGLEWPGSSDYCSLESGSARALGAKYGMAVMFLNVPPGPCSNDVYHGVNNGSITLSSFVAEI